MKHTNKPWIKDNYSVDLEDIMESFKTNNEWICVGQPDDENPNTLQNIVAICHSNNVPLITNAPEMLEILTEIIKIEKEYDLDIPIVLHSLFQRAEDIVNKVIENEGDADLGDIFEDVGGNP